MESPDEHDRARVADDPALVLRAGNHVRGVCPGPWTPTPRWSGESLDVGFAIDALRKPRGASDPAA